MGKLLSLLARDDSNCCTPQKYDVFLDFESEYNYYFLLVLYYNITIILSYNIKLYYIII